jgi:hypothetical protein
MYQSSLCQALSFGTFVSCKLNNPFHWNRSQALIVSPQAKVVLAPALWQCVFLSTQPGADVELALHALSYSLGIINTVVFSVRAWR